MTVSFAVRWQRCAIGLTLLVAQFALARMIHAERIDFIGNTDVLAGESFSLLVQLSDNNIPLVGYSLNVDVAGTLKSSGSVVGDAGLSNFFLERNLIARGGGILNPTFSLIIDPGDGGLFVNAIEQRRRVVNVATPGVNDVLAQLVFNVSPDATGFFVIEFGPFTTLATEVVDGPIKDVPFASSAVTVRVIPEPVTSSVLLMGTGWLLWRRSRRRRGCCPDDLAGASARTGKRRPAVTNGLSCG